MGWQQCRRVAIVSYGGNGVTGCQQCPMVATMPRGGMRRDGNSVPGWQKHHGIAAVLRGANSVIG